MKKIKPWDGTLAKIKQRCNYKKSFSYKNYGGKGIKCCITSEELKLLWIRDKAQKMEMPTIDRIDSSLNYTFENCRYLEKRLNSSRRRNNGVSKFVGIWKEAENGRHERWRGERFVNGKRFRTGNHLTEEDAVRAYYEKFKVMPSLKS